MAGAPSKLNPPNSHPSNPIHKAATAESGHVVRPNRQASPPAENEQALPPEPEVADKTPQHEINRTAMIVGLVAVAAFLLMASS